MTPARPRASADPARGRCALANAEHRLRLLVILADAFAGMGMTGETVEACKEIARVRDEVARLRAAPDPPRRRTVAPVET
jgi:hypothetical protein